MTVSSRCLRVPLRLNLQRSITTNGTRSLPSHNASTLFRRNDHNIIHPWPIENKCNVNLTSTSAIRQFSDEAKDSEEASTTATKVPKKTVTKTYDLDGNEIKEEENEIEVSPELLQKIRSLISSSPAVLFMKGSPDDPLCGYSYKLVQILDKENHFDDYTFVDVTKSDEVKEGVKKLTYWPTIPQLFVDGQFIGGFDIVESMNNDGELGGVLEKVRKKEEGE